MSTTSKGKISRLPKTLREEVNRRMENGERGASIVAWLNALPEVQAMLAAGFGGKPIREQNLSKWRKFGFKEWSRRREATATAAEIGELPVAGNSPVTSQIATWGSVRYLMAVRELVQNRAEDASNFKTLREFTQDVIHLRRADHRTARLQFEMEKLGCLKAETHSNAHPQPIPGVT